MLMFYWWLATRFHPSLAVTGRQPLHWAVLIYLISLLVSYVVGFQRGLTGIESNAADRALLGAAAFVGAVFLAADGISNWERLQVVLRVFVLCAAYMSIVGLLQEALPFNIVDYMRIPGLTDLPIIGTQERGSALRVASTTTHYLELAGALSFALPIAIHLSRFSVTLRERRRYGFAAVLITAGILSTISRAGIISAIIAVVMLMPLWPKRARFNVVALGLSAVGVMSALQPSTARTFYSIFANASSDSSITSRTERYAMVGHYFSQSPWLGRGTGTWVPPMYQYLDNQWLRTSLEGGIVGVAALAILQITAIVIAAMAFRRAISAADRHLCLALISTQVMAIFIAYTFDCLTYTTYAISLALMIGLCGAVWRFTHPTTAIRTSAPPGSDDRASRLAAESGRVKIPATRNVDETTDR
jgi:O-antigen ligase